MRELFEAAGLQVFERGWLSSNNVLFVGDESHGATLVDSGYCTHAAQTLALVRHALGARPLARVINTHLHSDHCGGNHALQEAYGCEVAVPAGEVSRVDAWDEDALTYRATGQQCPRFLRHGVITAGDQIWCGARRWRALAAPGHDLEGFVLYQPELQLLISADALWENGFGVVFPELEGEQAFHAVRATLDMISSLNVRAVIPGHGRPFDDVAGAITRAHRRLDGYIADPARHAQHAAKVLIKFHLLEVQQQKLEALRHWMRMTPYMALTHGRHSPELPLDAWCESLLSGLCLSGALELSGDIVHNR